MSTILEPPSNPPIIPESDDVSHTGSDQDVMPNSLDVTLSTAPTPAITQLPDPAPSVPTLPKSPTSVKSPRAHPTPSAHHSSLPDNVSPPRRSTRSRKPPKWQSSGLWLMDT